MRHLDSFVARRYLRPRGKGYALRSLIAVGGISVGVAALILVTGIMTGMQTELRRGILSATPHVMILEWRNTLRMSNWRNPAAQVRAVEGVTGVSPFILSTVVVRRKGLSQTADLYGVPVGADFEAVTPLERDVQEITRRANDEGGDVPWIFLGSRLTESLGAELGDTIVVIALESLPSAVGRLVAPPVRPFRLAGSLDTGIYDYDLRNAYVALEGAQDLLNLSGADEVSGLNLSVRDPWGANDVAETLRARLGPSFRVLTWLDTNRSLFSALMQQKVVMALVLFLIVIVAAFGVVSTLIMVVEERTSEIGILKSLGMTDGYLLRIFLLQGFWIGVAGTGIGAALGLTLSWIQDRFQIIHISAEVYLVENLRATPQPLEVLAIMLATVLVAVAASSYPAWTAARLHPVQAIRRE